jgi:hypothetical protein
MRITSFLILLFFTLSSSAQKRKPGWFVGAGIDFRSESIDIEDSPNPSPPQYGPPYENNFWKTLSLHGRFGYTPGSNWFFSTSFYTRYNAFHRIEGVNFSSTLPKEPRKKKNFKYDIFLDVEKKFRIKKNKERFLLVQGGVGFVNINTRFDVSLTDTSHWGTTYTNHYKGTLLHLGPRMSIGYQYERMKLSLDGYITEDAALSNLTAVWIGATLSYEFPTKKGTIIKEPFKKPDVVLYRKQSITRKKIGLALLAPTAALFILGRDNLNRNSPNYGNDRSGFTWAGIITGSASFYCLVSSRHQLRKSKTMINSTSY